MLLSIRRFPNEVKFKKKNLKKFKYNTATKALNYISMGLLQLPQFGLSEQIENEKRDETLEIVLLNIRF